MIKREKKFEIVNGKFEIKESWDKLRTDDRRISRHVIPWRENVALQRTRRALDEKQFAFKKKFYSQVL